MHPEIFHIGDLRFHAYPLCISIAFVAGTLLISREAQRQNPPFFLSHHAGLWAFVSAFFGARLFHAIQFPERDPSLWHAFILWKPGLVYYGGLIGAFSAVAIYLTVTRTPRLRTGDIALTYLPLGQAITRVGCFLNGCCWGRAAPEGLPWGVCFPKNRLSYGPYFDQVSSGLIDRTAAHSMAVHPTQLYMVVGLVAIFIVQRLCLRRKRFNGAIMLLYCLLYGVLRFTVESFRADSTRSAFGLTVSQAISVMLVVGALASFAALGALPIRGKGAKELVKEDNG
jgi:phosphatidylglycerol---prolipoprotein diacylglyceryl transferase